MRHFFLIRSQFAKAEISRYRLAISRTTVIPSLASQTCQNFELILRVTPRDPCIEERIDAFRSLGVPIHFQHPPELDSPAIVTRLDDDDAISCSFVARLQAASVGAATGQTFTFPNGMLFDSGRWYNWQFPGNMFVSIVSRETLDVFRTSHRSIGDRAKRINGSPAWCWIRHPGTLTTALEGYKKQGRLKLQRAEFPTVDFAEVMRLHRQASAKVV